MQESAAALGVPHQAVYAATTRSEHAAIRCETVGKLQ